MNKIELQLLDEMTEQEQEQYKAYCEEQARLGQLYAEQEEKKAILQAKTLLLRHGYKVEKIS